jgi:hypothetical protein
LSLTAPERETLRRERNRLVRDALNLDRIDAIGRSNRGRQGTALADLCFEQAGGDCEIALDIACEFVTRYGDPRGLYKRAGLQRGPAPKKGT